MIYTTYTGKTILAKILLAGYFPPLPDISPGQFPPDNFPRAIPADIPPVRHFLPETIPPV